MEGKIDLLVHHMLNLGGRMDRMGGRMDRMGGRMDRMERKTNLLVQHMLNPGGRVDGIMNRLDTMDSRLDQLQRSDVTTTRSLGLVWEDFCRRSILHNRHIHPDLENFNVSSIDMRSWDDLCWYLKINADVDRGMLEVVTPLYSFKSLRELWSIFAAIVVAESQCRFGMDLTNGVTKALFALREAELRLGKIETPSVSDFVELKRLMVTVKLKGQCLVTVFEHVNILIEILDVIGGRVLPTKNMQSTLCLVVYAARNELRNRIEVDMRGHVAKHNLIRLAFHVAFGEIKLSSAGSGKARQQLSFFEGMLTFVCNRMYPRATLKVTKFLVLGVCESSRPVTVIHGVHVINCQRLSTTLR